MIITKQNAKQKCAEILTKSNIKWLEFNCGLHWKIDLIDFWPTTGKWIDKESDTSGMGINNLVSHIKSKNKNVKKFSVEQIFQMAVHSKDKSLMGICASIHKGIYDS